THEPAQATLQQNPSAQKPDAHWAALEQAAPMGRLPQLPFTHLTLAAQSASEAQLVVQAPLRVSQLKGAQMVAGPGVQLPAPSQTRIPPSEAPLQVPGWQTVPAT